MRIQAGWSFRKGQVQLPVLIEQPEVCNNLQDRAPHDAPRTQLNQQVVVVRAHPVGQTSVCAANFGEQSGDFVLASHRAAPTIDNGSDHVVEEKWPEKDDVGWEEKR